MLPTKVHMAEGFQRRRLKCESWRRTPSDGKSSHCIWQSELKKHCSTCIAILFLVHWWSLVLKQQSYNIPIFTLCQGSPCSIFRRIRQLEQLSHQNLLCLPMDNRPTIAKFCGYEKLMENKANNKITKLQTILQRESQNKKYKDRQNQSTTRKP